MWPSVLKKDTVSEKHSCTGCSGRCSPYFDTTHMPWTFGYVPVQSSELKCQREAHVPVTHIPCTPHAKHWQQRRIIEENALWGAWAAWADGSGAEGVAFLAGRWGPAGSDEPTQFVSHPYLPQCCWGGRKTQVLPTFLFTQPLFSGPVSTLKRPMICSGSSTGAGIHWSDLLLRMKQWEKQAQVRSK